MSHISHVHITHVVSRRMYVWYTITNRFVSDESYITHTSQWWVVYHTYTSHMMSHVACGSWSRTRHESSHGRHVSYVSHESCVCDSLIRDMNRESHDSLERDGSINESKTRKTYQIWLITHEPVRDRSHHSRTGSWSFIVWHIRYVWHIRHIRYVWRV